MRNSHAAAAAGNGKRKSGLPVNSAGSSPLENASKGKRTSKRKRSGHGGMAGPRARMKAVSRDQCFFFQFFFQCFLW